MNSLTIIFIVIALFLQGCVAGYSVQMLPKSNGPSQHKCENFTLHTDAIFSDGFMVLYYIIPLVPLFNRSDTKDFLEIPISIISRKEPVYNLTLNDITIRMPNNQNLISPYKKIVTRDKINTEKPFYYKTLKFYFEINRHNLKEFDLVFQNQINGCVIPDTSYIRKEGTHYITRTF